MADVTVVLESDNKEFSFEDLGLSSEPSSEEVLEAVSKPILESGINIKPDGQFIYVASKGTESGEFTVYPKSPAGNRNRI